MKPVVLQSALDVADRGHVLRSLANFANKPVDQWLPPPHPARSGQLPLAWRDVRALRNPQLCDAVAAAGPNHCIDAWSYASRALAALMAGDFHAARHLAYYAQLRAGLSILANLGVGVFNRVNYVVCANGSFTRLDSSPADRPNNAGLGTHDVVWEALRMWAAGPETSKAFLDLVKIRGVSLRECLSSIWPGFATVGAASTLIEAWGVDLRRGKDEHRYRNISSYTPQAFNPLPLDTQDASNFIRSFWSLFEPTGGGGFDNLDRFLLRSLLLKQHRLVTGNSRYAKGSIDHRYDELPARIRALAPKEFLINAQQPRGPDMLQRAAVSTSPARPTEMLGRAFLLLRAATAFTHSSFVEAGLDAGTALRPWLDQWAASRGFWAPTDPLDDPVDLWADIEWALVEFDESLTPPPTSLNAWLRAGPNGAPTIFEAERIAVWSLCA